VSDEVISFFSTNSNEELMLDFNFLYCI
jgi:hypothetical protein